MKLAYQRVLFASNPVSQINPITHQKGTMLTSKEIQAAGPAPVKSKAFLNYRDKMILGKPQPHPENQGAAMLPGASYNRQRINQPGYTL